MVKVIIVQRIFPSYRKAFFDLLNQKIDLTLLHSSDKTHIDQISTNYSVLVKAFSPFKRIVFLNVFNHIIRDRPKIIVHESGLGIISMPFTMILCRILNIKFVIWGHGYNHKRSFKPHSNLEAFSRLILIKLSDSYITYGKKAKQLLSNYVNSKKIFVAANTIDTNLHFSIRDQLREVNNEDTTPSSKKIIIKKYNLLFLGRLIKGKEPQMLIDIFNLLEDPIKDNTTIHIIGDGPLNIELQNRVKNEGLSAHFQFYGKISDPVKSAEIIMKCDLLIIPGYLGLAINHAFCYGVPAISFKQTTSGPFHSPEVEYIVNNKTGFLISPKKAYAMAHSISLYLKDENIQKEIKKEVENKINTLDLTTMTSGFLNCFNYLSDR